MTLTAIDAPEKSDNPDPRSIVAVPLQDVEFGVHVAEVSANGPSVTDAPGQVTWGVAVVATGTVVADTAWDDLALDSRDADAV